MGNSDKKQKALEEMVKGPLGAAFWLAELEFTGKWIRGWGMTFEHAGAEASAQLAYRCLAVIGRTCVWTEDENGPTETRCENTFEFTEGGAEDNGFKFCPYCGGRMVFSPANAQPQQPLESGTTQERTYEH